MFHSGYITEEKKLDIVGLASLKLTEDKIQHNLSQGTLSNNSL